MERVLPGKVRVPEGAWDMAEAEVGAEWEATAPEQGPEDTASALSAVKKRPISKVSLATL